MIELCLYLYSEEYVLAPEADSEEPGDEVLIICVQRWKIIYDKSNKDWNYNWKKRDSVSYETGMPGNTTTVHCHYLVTVIAEHKIIVGGSAKYPASLQAVMKTECTHKLQWSGYLNFQYSTSHSRWSIPKYLQWMCIDCTLSSQTIITYVLLLFGQIV